jgi:hypothetical protein
MPKKCHVEALREMLAELEYDAQFLYQYGELSGSLDLFARLSFEDQRRLIALAFREGNCDAQNVARVLMGKLVPRPGNFEQMIGQLSPEDQREVEAFGQNEAGARVEMTQSDARFIVEELKEACNTFGLIEVEEAYWVLIPAAAGEEIVWIEAMGGEDELFTRIRSAHEIGYQPSTEELHQLITEMRKAKWILHLHNHPGMTGVCLPSEQDFRFAYSWKSLRAELACKMKFFIIQSEMAVEYDSESGRLIRWV